MKTYELLLSDESDEIMAISLVKDPAIMANWVYFNKDEVKFATVNEEKRIIVSPVLIPDIRIPRIDGQGNEYSVFFSASTIEKLAQKFLAKGYQHKATLEHSKNIDGDVTVVESWVSASREKDKSALYFERKFPAGTWFIAWKVNSDDLWENYVKTGKVLGASIEGLLEHKLVSMSIDQDTFISDLEEQDAIEMLGMIKGIIKKDNRYKAKKKIEMESYSDYPDSVSNNAKRGIELNDKLGNKCATPVGKIRAQQLANKRPLSVETISRMYAYLSRAEAYYDENDMNACGTISFYLWGGLAGKRWAESKLKELGKLEMSAVDLETSVSVASTYAGDFGTGSVDMEIQAPNVNVFGYHTRYFHMCPGAQSLFEHMITMPVDEDTIGMIRSAAQVADNVFRKEEEVIKAGVASQHDYEEVVLLVDDFKDIMHEIDEEVGMQHDVSFMDGHVIKVKEYLPIEMAEVGPRGGIKESPKAPKSDTKNPNPKGEGSAKGEASGKRGAKVTAEQEKTLENKVKDFNERESNTKNGNATLGALKSVFQRGLGAYNTSHSPNVQSAEQWAYARVNAFLYLLKNGRPENPKYTTDYDLLPKGHPKAS